jgi:transcriptional regulator with XRE-family HTH domain
MGEDRQVHVSERFRRLLSLYRRPDGSEWGGQDLERATSGAVTRSYVSNLKNGRIENPGLAKLEAIAGAMGFPPALWFGQGAGNRGPDTAMPAVEDGTAREIIEEVSRMGPKDRRLMLGIARQVATSSGVRSGKRISPRTSP